MKRNAEYIARVLAAKEAAQEEARVKRERIKECERAVIDAAVAIHRECWGNTIWELPLWSELWAATVELEKVRG